MKLIWIACFTARLGQLGSKIKNRLRPRNATPTQIYVPRIRETYRLKMSESFVESVSCPKSFTASRKVSTA